MMFNLFCSIYLQIRYVSLILSALYFSITKNSRSDAKSWSCNGAALISVQTFNLNQDIIRLPRLFRFLQRPLAQLISVLRAPKSKEGYASIGGGSPLRKITDDQVRYMPAEC